MPRRESRLLRFAGAMRRDPTPSEERVWRELRAGRFGVKLRRQEPIGPFIADFACRRLRLVVEFDGDSPTDDPKDRRHEAAPAALGWTVIRNGDAEVYGDLEAVLEGLWCHGHGAGEMPPLAPACSAEPISPAARERGRAGWLALWP